MKEICALARSRGLVSIVDGAHAYQALGAQTIMWATLGLVFGALTERSVIGRSRPQVKAAVV